VNRSDRAALEFCRLCFTLPTATLVLWDSGCGGRLRGAVCCVAVRTGTIRGMRAAPTATGTTRTTATGTWDFGWWCSQVSEPALSGGVPTLPGRGETWWSLFLAAPGSTQAGRIATAPHPGFYILVRGISALSNHREDEECHSELSRVRRTRHRGRYRGSLPVRHSRGGGNPGFSAWIPGLAPLARNDGLP
jgi:hypothetical protein